MVLYFPDENRFFALLLVVNVITGQIIGLFWTVIFAWAAAAYGK